MIENDPGYNFERCLVDMVKRMIEEDGVFDDHSKFARAAWGDDASSIVRWRQIRNTSGKKKRPQALTLRDAYVIAKACGMALPDLCFRVEQVVRAGWNWRDHDKYVDCEA